VIQFSTTLSRVRRVSIKGDYSSSISSGIENFSMVARGNGKGEGRGRGHDRDPGEGRDAEISEHIIMLTVVKITIHHLSAKTSLVNLVAQIAYTTFISTSVATSSTTASTDQTIECFLQLRTAQASQQLILPCMDMILVHLLFTLISLGY